MKVFTYAEWSSEHLDENDNSELTIAQHELDALKVKQGEIKKDTDAKSQPKLIDRLDSLINQAEIIINNLQIRAYEN